MVSLAGFLPTGALVLAFVVLATPSLASSSLGRIGCVCLLGVPSGYVAAAFARCEPGCPTFGSLSQTIHSAFGVVEYLGAVAGLLLVGASFRSWSSWRTFAVPSFLGSFLVLGGFVAMVLFGDSPWRGLFQRIAEAALFAWILSISIRLVSGGSRPAAARQR